MTPGTQRSGARGANRLLPLVLGVAGLGVGANSACDAGSTQDAPELAAAFGVFYGGQVQEREEIPFALDPARNTQGFRVTLATPAAEALEVRWELGRPGSGRPSLDSQGRKVRARRVQVGQGRFRPGETQFEQVLPFLPDDPLGLWNVRVMVGDHVVVDRPFWVYDEQRRQRELEEAQARDGGI